MTLLETAEPLFQFVCRLNRLARKGSTTDAGHARAEARAILERMRSTAAADVRLADQYSRVEKPLVFFLDSMIQESRLPWAGQWQPLSVELWDQRGYVDRFFAMLEEELADPAPAASERLAIYYTCLGLGFTGFDTRPAAEIRRLMLQISARIRHLMDVDPSARIVPDDQLQIIHDDMRQPAGSRLLYMGITLAGLVAVLIAANVYLFHASQNELHRDLEAIEQATTRQVDAGSDGTRLP